MGVIQPQDRRGSSIDCIRSQSITLTVALSGNMRRAPNGDSGPLVGCSSNSEYKLGLNGLNMTGSIRIGTMMLKLGPKGRFPRSLFLLLLLGAVAGGVGGCAGYGYSVGASYGYPYRYQYPYSPYGYYHYRPSYHPYSYGFGYRSWFHGYHRPYWRFRWIPHHFHWRFRWAPRHFFHGHHFHRH